MKIVQIKQQTLSCSNGKTFITGKRLRHNKPILFEPSYKIDYIDKTNCVHVSVKRFKMILHECVLENYHPTNYPEWIEKVREWLFCAILRFKWKKEKRKKR